MTISNEANVQLGDLVYCPEAKMLFLVVCVEVEKDIQICDVMTSECEFWTQLSAKDFLDVWYSPRRKVVARAQR